MSEIAKRTKTPFLWRKKSLRLDNGEQAIEEAKNFNPWQSMYRVSYSQSRPATTKATSNKFFNPEPVNSSMLLNNHPPKASAYRINSSCQTQDEKENNANANNFLIKKKIAVNRLNTEGGRSENRANIKPGNDLFRVNIKGEKLNTCLDVCDEEAREVSRSGVRLPLNNFVKKNISCSKEDLPSKVQTLEKDDVFKIAKSKNSLFAQFKNKKVVNIPEMSNVIGQEEYWLNPADKDSLPLHSKNVVISKQNFIETNIKNFIAAPNEYYPFFTGKCLCGECECGTCKCIHFKYKAVSLCPKNDTKTIYQSDYLPNCQAKLSKVFIPSEIQQCNSKIDFTTAYTEATAMKPRVPINEKKVISRALDINIGVGACSVIAPANKETQYKLDYPDWKCPKTVVNKPFLPKTFVQNLPMFGKSQNTEYGNFDNSEVERMPKARNPLHEKSSFDK
jgi:hypothetical protein